MKELVSKIIIKKKKTKKKTSRQKCNKYKIYDNDSLYRLNFWWN